MRSARTNEVATTDGEQTRDFCFIEDVVSANLLAAEAPRAAGQVFNIACCQAVSLNGVVTQLEEILGFPIERQHEGERAGDIRHSLADISLATEVLRYRPAVSFATGLRKTVDWFR